MCLLDFIFGVIFIYPFNTEPFFADESDPCAIYSSLKAYQKQRQSGVMVKKRKRHKCLISRISFHDGTIIYCETH